MVDAPIIFRGGKEIDKIVQPHEDHSVAEGGNIKNRQAEGVKSRPEEKNQDDDQLRSNQGVREPSTVEDALFHSVISGSK